MKPIMAVSSSGGHWSQLMLLRPAFEGHPVVYVSTLEGPDKVYGLEHYILIPDCNRNSGWSVLRSAWIALNVMIEVNPGIIVSTGALPGLMMIAFGRLTGRRTIWVESIANSERLSMCGSIARRLAHRCFVQWPELAQPGSGTVFAGSVL